MTIGTVSLSINSSSLYITFLISAKILVMVSSATQQRIVLTILASTQSENMALSSIDTKISSLALNLREEIKSFLDKVTFRPSCSTAGLNKSKNKQQIIGRNRMLLLQIVHTLLIKSSIMTANKQNIISEHSSLLYCL